MLAFFEQKYVERFIERQIFAQLINSTDLNTVLADPLSLQKVGDQINDPSVCLSVHTAATM